jgi:hypothetical protein
VSFSDQHVSVYGHENVADIRAHFYTLSEILHEQDFEHLSGYGVVDCGAKVARFVFKAIIYWIENVNETVDAIEYGINAHVFIKILFQLVFFILVNNPNHT